MSRSLHKVQKTISKKRGGRINSLHENSRDAQRLRRAGAREEKISKVLSIAARSNHTYVDRITWFQSAVDESPGAVSEEEMLLLTKSFIARGDEELESLKTQKRPGRPPTSHEDQLRQRIDAEKREFRSGFWIPDLREIDNRLKLEKWSGDWAGLNSLKFVRLTEGGGMRDSSFPPKGLS